jgi:hypothetical protein
MADKKISALTSLAQGDVAASTDVLPIVDTSATETKKITASALVGAGMTAGVTNVDINSGAIDGTTIGANSAAAGTFTNLTASGTVSFSGATVSNGGAVTTIDINGGTIDATSIGASSASTGAFTTLTTSSTVTLNGGTANGVLFLNGSKVATSGSAFVFDGTNVGIGTSTPGSPLEVRKDQNAGTKLLIQNQNSGASALVGIDFQAYGGGWQIEVPASATFVNPLRFGFNGTEKMSLTSTTLYTASGINVGIGTSSPGQKLEVAGNIFVNTSGNPYAEIKTSGSGNNPYLKLTADTNSWTFQGTFSNANDDLLVLYNATTLLDLTKDGNLGLGVTPSAWGASSQALQNGGGSFFQYNNDRIFIGQNSYIDSSFNDKFIGNGYATRYRQYAGTHAFYVSTVSNSSGAGASQSLTQAMTLDASSNLFVGGTTGSAKLNLQTTTNSSSDSEYIRLYNAGENVGYISWINGNGDLARITGTKTGGGASANDGILTFSTALDASLTERARITSGGYSKFSNAGTYEGSTAAYHELRTDQTGDTVVISNTNGSQVGSNISLSTARAAGTNALFLYGTANAVNTFNVFNNGNVTNTNNSYGAISDAKMKTDIVDAGSQWADIKAVRFRKFKMKDDPQQITQLGVVAQELEQTSPGLVDEHADRDAEGNDLGTTTKSVKSSILLIKAAVALQEAMARIEKLEAEMALLKGA